MNVKTILFFRKNTLTYYMNICHSFIYSFSKPQMLLLSAENTDSEDISVLGRSWVTIQPTSGSPKESFTIMPLI